MCLCPWQQIISQGPTCGLAATTTLRLLLLRDTFYRCLVQEIVCVEAQRKMSAGAKAASSPTWVLYVTTEKPCLGCRKVSELLDKVPPYDNKILVQDIKNLRSEGVELPSWLIGTPTLIEIASRRVLAGSAALQALSRICGAAGGIARPKPDAPTTELLETPCDVSSGSWDKDDAEPVEEEDKFNMELGCDPDTLSSEKVSMADVQSMMQSRGLNIPAAKAEAAADQAGGAGGS